MGAFDTYAAAARCPRCGDVHHVDGQTKFFDPDFFGLSNRHFEPWSPQPLDVDPADLRNGVWEVSWWRVREPGDPERLDLLVDPSEMFGCDCGAQFAVVLRFRVAHSPPSAMLTAIDLREASTPAALAVDFADGEEIVWEGDRERFDAGMAALASAPLAERQARLRAALDRRFAPTEPATEQAASPWWCFFGDVRCEACGAVRPRGDFTLLAHPDYPTSFFGPGWTGGTLTPGLRLAGDYAWLAEDVDRGYYTRLRHPVPQDRLTILGTRRRTSCRCGAGPGALALTFRREPDALVLAEAKIRVVQRMEDLADVDFAEAPHATRDLSAKATPRQWTWDREAVRGQVLGQHVRGY